MLFIGFFFVEVANTLQVNEAVLRKVIEWCEHHKNDPPTAGDDDDNRRKTTDIEEWDQKFMQVDQEMLFEIILVCFFKLGSGPDAHTNEYASDRPPTTLISRLSWMLDARLSQI